MRAVWLLARIRLGEMIHGPVSGAIYLGAPLLLALLVGGAFLDGHPFERRTLAVVGELPAAQAAALAALPELRLAREPDEARALAKLRTRSLHAALLPGAPAPRLLVGPREQLFARGLAASLPGGAAVTLVEVPRSGYVHFLFPGLLAITIVAGGLFGMGYTMVRYRSSQLLKKLATTPLSRAAFVASQIGSRAALVAGQLALLVAAFALVFDLPVSAAAAALLLPVALLGLLTFLGVGFILASLFRSESNLLDLINLLLLPLVFLSEIFFPAADLPAPLARLADLLPSTELVRLLRGVLLHGETRLAALGPGLALLAGWTLVTFAVAVRTFRWYDE